MADNSVVVNLPAASLKELRPIAFTPPTWTVLGIYVPSFITINKKNDHTINWYRNPRNCDTSMVEIAYMPDPEMDIREVSIKN